MTLRTHLGGSLFAEHLTGRPPTVLAMHGWGRNRSDLLGALEGREVISLDLPGFGASPVPPDPWGATRYADLVAEMLREQDTGPVLVLGHSFGGRVAVHLAADHPDLVSGAVLVGTPLWRSTSPSKGPLAYRVVRRLRRMRLVPEPVLDSMRRRHGSADYRTASGVMRDVLVTVVNEDYREQLAAITCPIGFCWGADDTAAPAALATEAAGIVANCVTLDVVDGAGHDVHRSHPHRLTAVIDEVAAATGDGSS
ncbi:MAG: alpha/beta hydrolase [Acidimicrobiales bacterium]|nr:alpha/beta hydrolase [Acidimicrobiales bacterium]